MNTYFVTIPVVVTEEQREAAEGHGWRVVAELNSDVMAAAVPTTVIEISQSSPEQAISDVAQEFGLDPAQLRIEER